jgi:hypothetical protein
VHNASDVRQVEVHAAEPIVSDPSRLEFEKAITTFKKYKSPGSEQILAELNHVRGDILLSATHNLITSVWNKEEFSNQWKESKLTVVFIVGYHCYQLRGLSWFGSE